MAPLRDQRGQGLVEYALILVLIAVVVIIILAILGPSVGNVFSNILLAIDPTSLLPGIHVTGVSWAGMGTARVTLASEDGSPITGTTTVTGSCDGSSVSGSGSGGTVSVSCSGSSFCVTGVSNSDFAYDSGSNTATCTP